MGIFYDNQLHFYVVKLRGKTVVNFVRRSDVMMVGKSHQICVEDMPYSIIVTFYIALGRLVFVFISKESPNEITD